MGKLPVWGTIRESCKCCFGEFCYIFQLTIIPMLIVCGLKFLSRIPYSALEPLPLLHLQFVLIAEVFLIPIAIIPFVVIFHRRLILNEPKVSRWKSYRFRKSELRYILLFCTIAISVFPVLSIIVSSDFIKNSIENETSSLSVSLNVIVTFTWGIGIIVFLFCGMLVSRLCMVFPVTAIGEESSFRNSWKLTKGHNLRIFAIFILSAVLYGLTRFFLEGVFWILLMYADASISDPFILVFHLFDVLFLPLEIFFIALWVGNLSLIFDFISDRENKFNDGNF